MSSPTDFSNPQLEYIQRNTHDNPITLQFNYGSPPVIPGFIIINNVFLRLSINPPRGTTAGINLQLNNVEIIPNTIPHDIVQVSPSEVDVLIPILNQQMSVRFVVIVPLPSNTVPNIDYPIVRSDMKYQIVAVVAETITNTQIEVEQPLIITKFVSNMPGTISLPGCGNNSTEVVYAISYENRGLYGLTGTIQFDPNVNVLGAPLNFRLAPGQPNWTFDVNKNIYSTTFFIAGTSNYNKPVLDSQQITMIITTLPITPPSSVLYTINQSATLVGVYPNGFSTRVSSGPPPPMVSPQTSIKIDCGTAGVQSNNFIQNPTFESMTQNKPTNGFGKFITFIPNNPKESKLSKSRSDKDPFVICSCKHRK